MAIPSLRRGGPSCRSRASDADSAAGQAKRAAKGEGGGGGGGFVAKPVGYIEISAGGARYAPIVDVQMVMTAAGMGVALGLLAGKVFGR
ncbi:MAG TPA: hypothetical protein VJ732_08025 [Bryobacteraceae bacterium]|nr:hypothetical protein [Bryobacteraceae bacterium]